MRGVKRPVVPVIRNNSKPSVKLATISVIPTRSCDHLSCFWLGNGCPHDASLCGVDLAQHDLTENEPLRQPPRTATGSSPHAHRSIITKPWRRATPLLSARPASGPGRL